MILICPRCKVPGATVESMGTVARCGLCWTVLEGLAAKETEFKFYAEDFVMMTSPKSHATWEIVSNDKGLELRVVRECHIEEFKHLPNMRTQYYYGVCNTPASMGKVRAYELQIFPLPSELVDAKHLRSIH